MAKIYNCIDMTRSYSDYTFHFDNGKTAVVKLIHGYDNKIQDCDIYGMTGKILAQFPSYLPQPYASIFERLWLYRNARYDFTAQHEELLNRLFAIKYRGIAYPSCLAHSTLSYHNAPAEVWLSMNINTVVDFLKNNIMTDPRPQLEYLSIKKEVEAIYAEFNITEHLSYIEMTKKTTGLSTSDFIKILRYTCREYNEYEEYRSKENKRLMELYEKLTALVPKSDIDNNYIYMKLSLYEKKSLASIFYSYYEIMNELKDLCELLGCNIPNGNPKKQLEYLRKAAAQRYNVQDNDLQFLLAQSKFPFKNLTDILKDDYEVEIPMNHQECTKIGNEFHNCVGGYEWNMYLHDGKRALVVFRDKKTSEKICCDIDRISHNICQFYQPCNNLVTERGLRLKKIVADWLISLGTNKVE